MWPGANLPAAYTAKGNPALRFTLVLAQKTSLLDKPPTYTDPLRRYDDILMNYLIAYETDTTRDGRLASLESNYAHILPLLTQSKHSFSPEFFSPTWPVRLFPTNASAYRKAF